MEIKEYSDIKTYNSEQELVTILEIISDKTYFNGYDRDDIILLIKEILKIDILSLSYITREQLLSTLCDAVSYYDIYDAINWDRLLAIKNNVEEDLQEYISDFFM